MGCEQNHICFRESWLAEKMSVLAHHIIKGHIKRVVKDPALAEKLTPNYDLGCKRITPSDTYLQVGVSHCSLHGNISRLVVGLPQIPNILNILHFLTILYFFFTAGVQQRLCVSDHYSDWEVDRQGFELWSKLSLHIGNILINKRFNLLMQTSLTY